MSNTVVLVVLNAKYIHASPAPWCLAAGIKAYTPEIYKCVNIVEATINQPQEQIISKIASLKPVVVSFSCYIWNITATLTLTKSLKALLPNITIILGGPEVSYCATEVLTNNPHIDYILKGEGEESVPAFLENYFADTDRAISGLCGRNPDGGIYELPIKKLEHFPPSPLTAGYSDSLGGRIAYIETSRDCPYSCAFCLSGRDDKPRFFPLETAFEDIITLANSGTKTIKFVDRTFNANPVHCNKILQFILDNYGSRIPIGICFHFEIAGDILREETFALLEQMPVGAIQLEIGMQSFCEKTLEAINRKTNTTLLQQNINRLVAMKNMHIHIDLIAGLPFEDLETFSDSFNTGYNLDAQMLQLGFLKLLHGSTMRSKPESYPCSFNIEPPYQVITTPWLSKEDIEILECTEHGVDKTYNSGRFTITLEYVLSKCGLTPFKFYTTLGKEMSKENINHGIALDDFIAFFKEFCEGLPNIDKAVLRDMLVKDRLATNSTGRLPACLYKQDPQFATILKKLAKDSKTAPIKGVPRGVAMLYSENAVCIADYIPDAKNPVTERWEYRVIPLS